MEALAVRLSGLDPYVDGAIRIVAFYDTLMRRRVDLPALARASAGLAECVAGIRLHGTGRVIRMSPDGTEAKEPAGTMTVSAPVTLDDEEIGRVWLERVGGPRGVPRAAGAPEAPGPSGRAGPTGPRRPEPSGSSRTAQVLAAPAAPAPSGPAAGGSETSGWSGTARVLAAPAAPAPPGLSGGSPAAGRSETSAGSRTAQVLAAPEAPAPSGSPEPCPTSPNPLDDVLLDRLAIAVAAVVERYGPARTTMADPALVELAVSADCEEAARARALRLLGFPPGLPVRVLAVRSRLPLDDIGARVCPDGHVKAAPLADVGVLLATAVDPARVPAGVRAGIGDPDSPERSWRQARTALRFTTAREPVVHHADLGALALLAEIPAAAVRENPDVVAVARIAAADPDDLDTLDAYCHTGSLRRAAELLHRHHSSVARRVEQLARAMGFDVTDPAGLGRARLALTAWRLLDDR
ncbi:helix-turn-helix domain-containing protein [Streptomyces sp. NPDC101160]|uniref:helix-turn-helix domain-containing protein n=1 Tax=Streptomyces sp. NPDC101160 TaxID=3366118 RepID=UPI0037FADA12